MNTLNTKPKPDSVVLIHFDSPEALLEALCAKQYGAFPVYDNAPEQWRSQCMVARTQRDEWKSIASQALRSFRCTQSPETYPEGHWSRRAQSLLEID